MYKYDDDEEEFYLDCYDEMHNHVLIADPRIMPFPKKNFSRPRFPTSKVFVYDLIKA